MMLKAPTQPILTDEQIATYYREGYLVVPDLVRHATIDAALAADERDYSQRDFWSPQIFDHDAPTANRAIHQLLVEPAVVEAVEALFEAPARVYYGMLAVVPARGGRGLPWHQDNMYTCLLGRALNVFMALCDIPPEKANLWVAPRSHLQGVQPSHSAELHHGHRQADVEPANGIPLPGLKKGDACIFNRMTLHRSLRNETDEHRYAYAAQYMEDKARDAATGEKDAKRMRARDLARVMRG